MVESPTGANAPSAPAKVKAPKWWQSREERRELRKGLLFISPWIFGFFAFILYPIYYTFRLSFTRYGGFIPPVNVGWANYERLLHDGVFHKALTNTLFITFLAVPIGVVVAMLLALAMNQNLKEISIYRVILYLPSVMPIVGLSLVFWALMDPNSGIFNELLRQIGLNPPNWFADVNWSKPALVFMSQFGAGQIALVFLAGLKGIPTHLYEAATIDGAGNWSKFFNITLPLMTPVILYDLILGISLGLQYFAQVFLITNGGPNNSTKTLVFYIYDNSFRFGNQMGYASAIGVFLFLLTFAIAALVFATSSRWVHYDLT